MATNRDLLKEAIADAKAVKETAIANAKAALEEAFTPYLKEKLSAKLAEMEQADEEVELRESEVSEVEKEMKEMKKEKDMTEEVSLDELLAELEKEESMEENVDETYMDEDIYEAKDEEEMNIEDMSEDDLKSFIEDVIKDMVAAGELEAGDAAEGEGEEIEMGDEEMEMGDEEIDEDIDITELLAELDEMETSDKTQLDELDMDIMGIIKDILADVKGSDQYISPMLGAIAALAVLGGTAVTALSDKNARAELKAAIKDDFDNFKKNVKGWLKNWFASKKSKSSTTPDVTAEQLDELRSELNEVNLLNAKLLYTNKIFRNKSLTESQKVKVLTSFDKATSKKEVELVYETLMESLKTSIAKAPIKESLGSASKVLGGAASKPIIENDAFARMRELAFGKKTN